MKATKRERMTPELRKRLAEINIGRKQSEETKSRRAESMRGRVVSEETRRKISEANKAALTKYYADKDCKCRKPKPPKEKYVPSEETRAKMRAARLGRKLPESQMLKMRAIAESRKGVKRSKEIRDKIGAARKAAWDAKKACNVNPDTIIVSD
jgi:hypothetical protein